MKKYVITTLLFFLFMGINTGTASAKIYTENGISYEVKHKEAIVTGVNVWEGDLVIPSTLGGFKVRTGRRPDTKKDAGSFHPAGERRSFAEVCSSGLAVWMRIILPIWRISTWGIAPGFTDM